MASSSKKMRTNYKYLEKVVCSYCNSKMLFKNLRKHIDIKHGQGKDLNYRAADVKSVLDMFPPASSTVLEREEETDNRETEDMTEDNQPQENRETEDMTEENQPQAAAFHTLDKSFIESGFKLITEQLSDMSSMVKKLATENKELKEKIGKKKQLK